ncbi:hypothetical protein c7_L405 [Megavirus courdo7]|uniref:Uncharacterized protein n=2 Tax=Megavirus TaxID=3044761 RepID=L7XXU0_9VIRU|nr:hypothetical protein c7_L405 [Megavirus courdo7]AGD92260.1 hypothetical protein LBA_00341 [Megavirus lba]
MSNGILKILSKKYKYYMDNECIDLIQIKMICNLSKTKSKSNESIRLSEINLSSPEFKTFDPKLSKNQIDMMKSQEFIKNNLFLFVLYLHV